MSEMNDFSGADAGGGAGGAGKGTLRFELRRPVEIPGGLALALLIAFLISSVTSDSDAMGPAIGILILIAVLLLAPMFGSLLRARQHRHLPLVIELLPDRLRLPRSATDPRPVEVSLQDVLSVWQGPSPRGIILIDTKERSFSYPLQAFVDQNAPLVLQAEVVQRINQLLGERRAEEIRERNRATTRALLNPGTVTRVLLYVLGAVYVLELFSGVFRYETDPFGLVRFGANVPALVEQGEWFRLISANFLHGNVLHILLNGLALYGLGFAVERLLGRMNFLFVYLVSALTGALASFYYAQGVSSVGASTAICGLLGAYAYVHVRLRTGVPAGFRQPLSTWFWIFAVNAVLPAIFPIDVPAHIGGFLGGALATAAIVVRPQALPIVKESRPTRIAATVLAVIFGAGLALAAINAAKYDDAKAMTNAKLIVAHYHEVPDQLNEFGWRVALTRNVDAELLALAERAAARAVELEKRPDAREAARDTLATLAYRLGDFDRAVKLEREALNAMSAIDFDQVDVGLARRIELLFSGGPEGYLDSYATQLARFLHYRTIARGPWWDGVPPIPLDLKLTDKGRTLEINRGGELATDVTVYAVARDGAKIIGLLRAPLRAGDPAKATIALPKEGESWSFSTTLDVALVSPGLENAGVWTALRTVLEYP